MKSLEVEELWRIPRGSVVLQAVDAWEKLRGIFTKERILLKSVYVDVYRCLAPKCFKNMMISYLIYFRISLFKGTLRV